MKGGTVVNNLVYGVASTVLIFGGITQPVFAEDSQVANLKYEVNATVIFINNGTESLRQHIEVGKNVSEPNHMNKDGYHFLGWQDEETGEFWDFTKPVTKNMRLIAIYEKIPGWVDQAQKNERISNITTSQGAFTGITSQQYFYYSIAGIAAVGLLYMVKKGEEDNN